MTEENVFVLSTGSENIVLETIQWMEDGLLSFNLIGSEPICETLRNKEKVQLFGVHTEARINVFLNEEFQGNCNRKYVCSIKECIEKDGIIYFVIQVVKKVVLCDLPSMTKSFFTKFLKNRVEEESQERVPQNGFFAYIGSYR